TGVRVQRHTMLCCLRIPLLRGELDAEPSESLLNRLVNAESSKCLPGGLERLTSRLPHCRYQPWRSPATVGGFVQIAIPLVHPGMRAVRLPRLARQGVVDHPRVFA